MITVTIKFGLTKELTTEVQEGASIRSIIGNASVKAVLGFPENVVPVIGGTTVSFDDTPSDGDVIVLERQAAEKAA